MGIATGGEWRGSVVGNTMDGMNMLPAIQANAESPRKSIVHYADAAGNVSYQYENLKLVRSSLRVLAASEPVSIFLGEQSAVNECVEKEGTLFI